MKDKNTGLFKNIFLICFMITFLGSYNPGYCQCTTGGYSCVLEVPLITQEMDNDCWAACGVMALQYRNLYVSVNNFHSYVSDYDVQASFNRVAEKCKKSIKDAMDYYLDDNTIYKASKLSFDNIKEHVVDECPVIALRSLSFNIGHYVVITGWSSENVSYNDPDNGYKTSRYYAHFVSGDDDYRWTESLIMPEESYTNPCNNPSDVRAYLPTTPGNNIAKQN